MIRYSAALFVKLFIIVNFWKLLLKKPFPLTKFSTATTQAFSKSWSTLEIFNSRSCKNILYTLFSHKLIIRGILDLPRDLENRFKEHNNGKSYYTKRKILWVLKYYEVSFINLMPLQGRNILNQVWEEGT